MKKFTRAILVVVIVILLAMTWGWFNIWRSPAYYSPQAACNEYDRVLTMAQYGSLVDNHARPYIVKTQDAVVFGAEHTRDPHDSQIGSIETTWDELKPTVALIEGRLGFLIPYAMDPVVEFGESGQVAALAKRDGTALYTWELPRSELVARLLNTFTPEQIALQQILTPYFSNYRFGKPDDPDQFVQSYLNRAGYPGLNSVITSVDDIDRIWQRDFADHPDWRETSDQYGLPGYLSEMAAAANLVRNQHLVCVINELRADNERIFVICGLSHAVCVEPALGQNSVADSSVFQ